MTTLNILIGETLLSINKEKQGDLLKILAKIMEFLPREQGKFT
tara:strand:- start:625 stop:753 length:129 start_codon:yes stop_codon:yes gene_type:complete